MAHLRSAAKRVASEQSNVDMNDKEAVMGSHLKSDCERPVKKRRRGGVVSKKQKTTKEKRGLSQLCIDELYIVFLYVYPMDLLNLARTCKYFRDVLMHKSSQFLWKDALCRVDDLPDCPVDLTEPQYINLVFYTRCHVCDKPAASVLWNLRRRYCSACKARRLRCLTSCDWRFQQILPRDKVKVGRDAGLYVDRDQLDLFMMGYHSSADKAQFVDKKKKLFPIIHKHARDCAEWQRGHGRVKRFDLDILRKEREESIFERLKQNGYGPEIKFFGRHRLQDSYKDAFKQRALLTDNGWEQMWPKWVAIMNDFRLLRLDATCYQPRRKLLVSEYDTYVGEQKSGTPVFDLLPHVADLASFPPFRVIIEAPENIRMGEEPFGSAFKQLPALIPGWKQQLDIGLAELVKIPPHLSLQDAPSPQGDESNQKSLAKLRLACALFRRGSVLFTHREVFFTAMDYHMYPPAHVDGRSVNHDQTGTDTIQERYNLAFLEEFPYIIHTCGLDPNVATADDMDRRNARLKCLVCSSSSTIVMSWRDAMLHTSLYHEQESDLTPLSKSPRWQIISDDHIEAIQAIEVPAEDRSRDSWVLACGTSQCLLCRPRIGDGFSNYFQCARHMHHWHDLDMRDLEQGVHYARIGLRSWNLLKKAEMVEEGGQVIFRRPEYI